MPRDDPLRNFRYRVEIDSVTVAHFSEVAFGEATGEPIDYREGSEPARARKLPGRTKYDSLSLRWGVTDSVDLFEWHKAVAGGGIDEQRKAVSIVVIDEAGADKATFMVSRAWPTKCDASDLNAKGNEVFIELLELANGGVERTA